LNSTERLRGAEYDSKLYIADHGDVRATGTDGVISGATLDAASISDWTALSIDTYNYVVVISNGTGAVADGTYFVDSIASGELTLTASPGDGTCTYHIERGPKIYDPAANTLTLWQADSGEGQVPTGAKLIRQWRGRMVLAVANEWYMSRQLDPNDWDYGDVDTDYARAVAGTNTEVGHIGQDIKSIMSHHDDYIYFGCLSSVYILRGDPTSPGATLGPASETIGCVGGDAWTITDDGVLVWLGDNGLYGIPYGSNGLPTGLSKSLPRELNNLTSDHYQVSIAFDRRDNGCHIFVNQSGVTQTHWWLDWMTRGLFPVVFGDDDHTPYCALIHSGSVQDSTHVLLGCNDGYVRHFSDFFNTDDGTEIESFVELGPFRLGGEYETEGRIDMINGVLGYNSGSVDWSIQVSTSAEKVYNADTLDSGTWDESGGVQRSVWPMLRGKAAIIRLDNSNLVPWAMEVVTCIGKTLGRQRLL